MRVLTLIAFVAIVCVPTRVRGDDLSQLSHMNRHTQAVYDRIRLADSWMLGLGRLGPDKDAGDKDVRDGDRWQVTNTVMRQPDHALGWWEQTYGGHFPVCFEFDLSMQWGLKRVDNDEHRARTYHMARSYWRSGGIPWLRDHVHNFATAGGTGKTRTGHDVGSFYDTSVRIEGVLPGGAGREAYLAYYRTLAREIAALDFPVVFRPFHEANGGWFWWGRQPENFVAMWREVHDLFQDAGAKNVIWCWNICASTSADEIETIRAYYPGDEYVDILSINDYFVTPQLSEDSRRVLEELSRIGGNRPLFFGGIGPQASVEFYRGIEADLMNYPRLKGMMLWWGREWSNWSTSSFDDQASIIDEKSDPDVMTAFLDFIANPRVVTLPKADRKGSLVKPGWILVFNDEFLGGELDTNKWTPHDPWGRERNNELQAYIPDALRVGNGLLRIVAEERRAEYDGALRDYTSGMMNSFGKFGMQYGYFEIRANVPKGNGLWPAFWLLPDPLGWPPEIDVLEILGHETDVVYFTTHWRDENDEHKQYGNRGIDIGTDFGTGLHRYALEWRPGVLIWYVDGIERFRTTHGVPDSKMFMLVNLAVGGEWPGPPDEESPFPSEFIVDHVRVWVPSLTGR